MLALVLPTLAGCTFNRLQPGHFQFVTVIEKTEPGAGGWRAACIHARMTNMTTYDSFVCKFGVGMPLETGEVGSISTVLAQRIAADCGNQAADIVIDSATAATTPGLACQEFKDTFDMILNRAVLGSRVTTLCDKKTKPVKFGF
ncbi:hypothetical protein F0U60_45535 [Archangium minus]|uniref:Lipoprotein n=1 Tax=Archangium minus TaxID=83450 RepID=A0ABY9X5A4_9BACT|nr:hypothetical protein F0U61_45705 [Archangium violaceum]WNG50587.1 hypothetical protein F0U60_45535 [Archangium minus]